MDRLNAWCDWAGVDFHNLSGKKRMAVVLEMRRYYAEHPPIVPKLKLKYRAR